jgi:hypothetical protein
MQKYETGQQTRGPSIAQHAAPNSQELNVEAALPSKPKR